ncbi:MAG: YceI family protein [Devosiaceae bacterium]|nr:YceI family protein [Devosiaceae bacterium MH13]
MSRTPRLLAALVAATALSAPALSVANAADLSIPSGTYASDPTHTSLFWSVNHLGLSNYKARFNTVSAMVELNAEDVTQSTMTATIEMASVDTDYPFPENTDFNAELVSGDWLNASDHPQATFTSTEIVKTGDTTATISGDLSFRGVTLPIKLDAELVGAVEDHPFVDGAAFGIQAVGMIDRTEFGFGTFAPMIGTAVSIEINAEFIEQ